MSLAVVPAGLATLGSAGPHGFSEIVYAFSSAAASNGSAMAGLGPNTFYDVSLGLAMEAGRYATIVPALALRHAPHRHAVIRGSVARSRDRRRRA